MRLSRPPLLPPSPSSSLSSLRAIESLTQDQIFGHLQALSDLYCPFAFHIDAANGKKDHVEPNVDSGYVSETEEDDDGHNAALSVLRADGFEKSVAERWLTGLVARAETLSCFDSEDECERALDLASRVLETFFASTADENQQMQEELAEYTRDFSFQVASPDEDDKEQPTVCVRLNDGLAGTDSSNPDDVGLQSWGASIVLSRLLCAHPDRFGLTKPRLGESPRIVELGAGTGLVSLVLHKLLPYLGVSAPTIVATDYHPAVLDNLRKNIVSNVDVDAGNRIPTPAEPVHVCALDWSNPTSALQAPPLDTAVDMLIATDVIYALEHAVWLRDCSTRLLAPDGVFWLVATVRQNGRFEGVSATVEAAFAAEDRPKGADGRRLTVVQAEKLEKLVGVGRGDESGYKVFRIEWV